ncbi:hypothetical protein CORC01_14424 [Colletotrichum orchidophilum]|uniref:Chromo domain-containing protein n=1 Tax=Colletotrichum orchidophilum TaxID=1209926 RepID=A0A1G4AM83_9PEZI|nr:uncharacterized protein CORC01_14424 [Colletotrichum orchidophilum]OHE90279.1 hypothetical protein CORC01_14424 [Colletotrichum orchidophilum]
MVVRRGSTVHAAWSSCLEVVAVICTATSGAYMFYGVVVGIRDPLEWDWRDACQLLWVFEDEDCIKVWQECVERPRPSNAAWVSRLQCIVGCYETDDGTNLYAVKWDGYACPTWEAEEDLYNYGQLMAEHDETCQCAPGLESRYQRNEWNGRGRRKVGPATPVAGSRPTDVVSMAEI